mgnify:FL=1
MQLILTLDDTWQPILDRALIDHGPDVVTDLVVNWLLDRQRLQRELDATAMKARVDRLTDAEKALIPAAIRAKIGL